MIIAIDFDGTCVTHEYPNVGKDIGAVPVLERIVNNGHKIILWTMRSGKELDDAVEWFNANNIKLWGINENPQQNWTTSKKQHANIYIDDAALGCPLMYKPSFFDTPFADWNRIEKLLEARGVI
jgi:hypothetical protein